MPPVRCPNNFINPVDPARLNGIRLGYPQWRMPLNYQDVNYMMRYSMNISPEGATEDPDTRQQVKTSYGIGRGIGSEK